MDTVVERPWYFLFTYLLSSWMMALFRLWNVQCSQIVSFPGPIDKICSVVTGDFLERQWGVYGKATHFLKEIHESHPYIASFHCLITLPQNSSSTLAQKYVKRFWVIWQEKIEVLG